ncbi:MAG: pyruvate kinase [Acidimicrobiia bacterium]|nr:pyruvate kinase [Acidimicrobiia bacterium]
MRKTKIIATLGPAVASYEAVRELVQSGMDVARLNFSHGDYDSHRQFTEWVRAASAELGKPVAVLQDIQGPRIRVGTFPGGSVNLETGSAITLISGEGLGSAEEIYVENLAATRLTPGSTVLMSDGLISLSVVECDGETARVRVDEGGLLRDHKGVAFPGSVVDVPAVSHRDVADLAFGRTLEVDYIAASFVSSALDVRRVKNLVPGTPVIAKIESVVGFTNLDEILTEAHGTMVARGDLGVELSFEAVPRAQKSILNRSNARAKISITATEMLESMNHSTRPTRAEVSDVAAAVLDGSDAVMLSSETAVGKYPARSVRAMAKICREAEASPDYGRGPEIHFLEDNARFASATAQACVDAAENLNLRAIVAFTESGSTARLISKYRPRTPIFAYTPHEGTFRRLALYSGVTPIRFSGIDSTDLMIEHAEQSLLELGIVERGDGVVIAAGIPPNQAATTNLMKLHSIGSTTSSLQASDR